ncbi:hypothetical protein AGMMS49928_11930 [Spirochaetia bacterium]|nr:hypothetical protein AGMMS49928_11930 [Spirochaetia bacterium]
MAGRSFTYSALVLRSRPSGESNREAWFLTAEEGILRAVVFGGPKSRLRSHVAPFHRGKLYVYYDPVRDSRKVNDFDVQSWRPGLRELYERSAVANAIAETILAGHGGGGNWNDALRLADETLEALDNADENFCARLLVYFLWQWIDLLGLRPETITLNPGARLWLAQSEQLPAAQLSRYTLDTKSFREAKTLVTTILSEAFGRRLTSWDYS